MGHSTLTVLARPSETLITLQTGCKTLHISNVCKECLNKMSEYQGVILLKAKVPEHQTKRTNVDTLMCVWPHALMKLLALLMTAMG